MRFNLIQFVPPVHSFVFAVFIRSSSTGLNGYFEISLNSMAGFAKLRDTWGLMHIVLTKETEENLTSTSLHVL